MTFLRILSHARANLFARIGFWIYIKRTGGGNSHWLRSGLAYKLMEICIMANLVADDAAILRAVEIAISDADESLRKVGLSPYKIRLLARGIIRDCKTATKKESKYAR